MTRRNYLEEIVADIAADERPAAATILRHAEEHRRLQQITAHMLGAAEVDRLDEKSNVWRSIMEDAREVLNIEAEKG